MTAKQFVIDAVQELPDSLTMNELLEELSILAALRQAQLQFEAGDFIEHEDMEREIATWYSE